MRTRRCPSAPKPSLRRPRAGCTLGRQRRASESHRAAVGLRNVDPIDPKLELVAQRHVIKLGLNLDLAVDVLVHPGEIILDPLKCRGPVRDLDDAGGLVDRQRVFAYLREH